MLRILVTGSNGQLGSELRKIHEKYKYYEWVFTDSKELDITDGELVMNFFEKNDIDICINCAAYTAVEKAETNKEQSMLINCDGVLNLVKVCEKYNVLLIHISTDYVFDGYSNEPYDEEDRTNPLNVYGKTKRCGEVNIIESDCSFIIIRTSWLYSSFGNNFVKTMLKLGSEKEEINVINNQIGCPTFASDLANTIILIIDNNKKNYIREIFHYCNDGYTNWFEFAKKIFDYSNKLVKVFPISTEEYGSEVKRPLYSVLDNRKIKNRYNIEIPCWEESLKRCLEEINKR